jgi:hypothetical protein
VSVDQPKLIYGVHTHAEQAVSVALAVAAMSVRCVDYIQRVANGGY